MDRLTIRIDFADGTALGPGKVRLLELVAETGSIRKAAAKMKMSYRRAWLLLQSLAAMFGEPLAQTATGGKRGGGAHLTSRGTVVVRSYRALEAAASAAGATQMSSLSRLLSGKRSVHGAMRKMPRQKAAKPGKTPRKKLA